MRLKDDVVVVTGAGRGIGSVIATTCATEGARVVVADLDPAGARRASDEIVRLGGEALPLKIDVGEPAEVQHLVDETMARFGRLDVLINNAGVGLNQSFLTTALEQWELQLRVNLTGQFLCGQAAARVMAERGGGRIVNVASISGQRGGQGRSAYGASKAGVIQLTKVMAVELAPLGIRVNAVSPGPVDTDQSRQSHTPATREAYFERIPVRRYGLREEIAAAVLFLASRESSFVTGHTLNVDGGFDAAGLIFDDHTTHAAKSSPTIVAAAPAGNANGNGVRLPAKGPVA
jgi:NAD(P)-dependent dehydrogenase (short-subunit alcohol dehydrogenase family)